MSDNTKIEWCDSSWSPVTGCTPISEGCAHCFAKRMAENRLRGRFGYPQDDPFRPGVFHVDKIDQPTRWRKPRRIFVCSMGDLFHFDVDSFDINRVWMEAFNNPRHTFMFLTKRPDEMKAWTEKKACATCWPIEDIWPSWMWLGVTAENQARADERIPILMSIPAAVRFVSVEPMLGPVNLGDIETKHADDKYVESIEALYWDKDLDGDDDYHKGPINWVIVGGETGPGARAMNPDWVRGIRDQCIVHGVPFFFKNFHPRHCSGDIEDGVDTRCGGRMLDGKVWHQFPEV